jgi:gliding motility-associated-like protein
MKKITLMLFMIMLSVSSYAQLALEGFETWPVGAGGWTIYQNGIGSNTWQQGAGLFPGFNSANSATVASQNVPPPGAPEDWLITKQFTVPTLPQLHFMSRFVTGGDSGARVDVRISTSTDPSTFVSLVDADGWGELEINPNPNHTVFLEKVINIPASYVNQPVYIAFVFKSINNGDRWIIDNVSVDKQCLKPTNLNATSNGTTTATISFSNPSGATTFEVEAIPAAQAPTGSGFIYTGNGAATTTLTIGTPPNPPLADATNYKYYVRAICSSSNSSEWAGPYAFSTIPIGSTCAEPIAITSTPFQANGNTAIFPDFINGTPGAAAGCGTAGTFLNGNDVFYKYTPDFTGDVSFVMSNNGADSGMFIYSSCANVGVTCAAGGTGTSTTPVRVNMFPVTAGTSYYIVISTQGTTQSTPYTLTIQRVYCIQPVGEPTQNVGPLSASLYWSNPGTSTSWQVAVQPAGTGLPSATATLLTADTNQGFLVENLQQATAYEYYVRADCGNGTFSAWSGPYLFTTTQIPAAVPYTQGFEDGPSGWTLNNGTQPNKWSVGPAVSNGGTNSLYISNNNGAANAYTTSVQSTVQAYRDLSIPAGANEINISFDWKAIGEATTSDYFRVWLVPVTFNPQPGTQINTLSGGVQIGGTFNVNSDWTTASYTINSTAFDGELRRLVFEWRNNANSAGGQPPAAIDNINVSVVTCSVPTGVALSSVTATQASLTWVAPTNGAESYDYYYSLTNTAPTVETIPSGSTTAPNVVLDPLLDSSTYYFWVRSNCGTVNGNSFWVGPFIFYTQQIPATLNYTDTFEVNPTKWTLSNGTQANKWVVGTAVDNGGDQSLYISNDNGVTNAYTANNAASVVHAYRDFTVPAGTSEIEVSFDWKSVGQTTTNDYFRVWLVPTTFNPVPGTQILANAERIRIGDNFNGNATWKTSLYALNAAGYAGQNRRLVFEWRNDATGTNGPPAAIDNVNIVAFSCIKPTALAVPAATITQTTAVLNWTENNGSSNWQVYVVQAGAPAPTFTTAGTPVTGAATYTAGSTTPLLAGTTYEFYVRTDCGAGGFSRWAGPFQFTTKIANDECATAIMLPVNSDSLCAQTTLATILGATASPQPNTCAGVADDDVWFEFVATKNEHYIALLDTQGANGLNMTLNALNMAVYSGTCTSLTNIKCNDPNSDRDARRIIVTGLVPGQTYKIRIYSHANTPQNFKFRICVGVVLTCADYQGICSSEGVPGVTFLGSVGVPSLGARSCLSTTPNPTFFAVKIGQSGNVVLGMSQTSLETGLGIDVDYIAYGPFDSPTAGCEGGLTAANQRGCSYSAAATETFTINNAVAGKYYIVMITNFNGARSTVNFTQSNIGAPGAGVTDCSEICNVDFGADKVLCGATQVVLDADIANATTYTWYFNDEVIAGATGKLYTATQTGAYKVVVTKTTCPSNPTDTINLVFGPAISLPVLPAVNVCGAGGFADVDLSTFNSIVLGTLNPADYVVEYYTTAAAANDGVAPITAVPFTVTNQILYVRVESAIAGTCYDVAELPVTVSNSATATISYAGSPYCSSETTGTVTQSGNAGGAYSSTTGLSIDPVTGAINIAASTPGTYTVTYTIAGTPTCPPFSTATPVVIVEAPMPVIAYGTSPYCSNGGTAVATLTGTQGGVYSSTAGLVIDPATGDINLATSTPGSYTVSYTVAATADCPGTTVTAPIVITALPVATISYSATAFCSNAGTAAVNQTGASGGTYSSTTGLVVNPATGEIDLGASTAGTYTVTYTIAAANGCEAVPATAIVTVTAAPQAAFTYSGTGTFCQNIASANASLTGSATAGVFTADAPGLVIDPATGTIYPATSTAGTYIVTNTIAAANGCTQVTHPVTVVINPAPVATFHYQSTAYCDNVANPSPILDGVAGTFSSTAGLSINATTGVIDLENSVPGTYVVTNTIAQTPQCPEFGQFTTVTVNPAPTFTVDQGCDGNEYVLNVNFTTDEFFTVDNTSIVWTNSAGGVLVSEKGRVVVTAAGTYTATVTALDGTTCSTVQPTLVNNTTCMVQRGISPNGDGLNDTFDLTALDVKNIAIFNRYGSKVFSQGIYTNEWHGQGKGGDELPTGTYFYTIERANGENVTGWVYINREE